MQLKLLLKELDKLNIPKDKMCITSSGPMGVRNMREINDLDIIVYPEVWQKLKEKYEVNKNSDIESIEVGNIQVLGKGSWFTDPILGDTKENIDNADVIDGYRYMKLDKILKIKKLKSREKDKKDVLLIEEYLKQHG